MLQMLAKAQLGQGPRKSTDMPRAGAQSMDIEICVLKILKHRLSQAKSKDLVSAHGATRRAARLTPRRASSAALPRVQPRSGHHRVPQRPPKPFVLEKPCVLGKRPRTLVGVE